MNRFSGAYDIKNRCLMTAFLFSLFLAWIPCLTMAAPSPSSTAANDELEEERWFQIELILFAPRDGKALEAEQWPDIEGLALPEDLLELALPTEEPLPDELLESSATFLPTEPSVTEEMLLTMPVAYQMLETKGLQLSEAMKKLQRSKQFKPLLHVAWRQPTVEAAKAKPVILFEGMTDPLPTDEAMAGDMEETTDMADGETPIPPEQVAVQELLPLQPIFATEEDANIGPENPRFAGTVRLSVTRYLHLAADLVYRVPVTQQVAIPISDLQLWYDRPYPTLRDPQGPAYQLKEWQAVRGFRMQESRRMRSKKIHYLDHPFFGMVVLVTPIELPKELPEPLEEIENPASLVPLNINTSPASTDKKR